jgi:transcriptional regulator with XRE-family HTH domain
MKQPDLGLKVSELRQQKGLRQEQLAERGEVSPRTIQRIESGEVDPRAFTLHCLSTALEFDFGEENTANENLWLTILHLSSMFCVFIVPLLPWSRMKKPVVQDRPAGAAGAQFPDHHDSGGFRRRFAADAVSRRALSGGRGGRAGSGGIPGIHPGDHLSAGAPGAHLDYLRVSGRGQCHTAAGGETRPLRPQHPVREITGSGDGHPHGGGPSPENFSSI